MRLELILRQGRQRLEAAGIPCAARDARFLAEAAFHRDHAALIRDAGKNVPIEEADRFETMIVRRLRHEPVGRILGCGSFWGLDFLLSPETLEPRADTETLVDAALNLVRDGKVPDVKADGEGLFLADIGTGSGAIAIALLHSLAKARGVATDIAEGALAMAEENARRHGVAERLIFRQGNGLTPVDERCGLLLSNPPYIRTAEIAELMPEVRLYDPIYALDGGPDGLVHYRSMAAGAQAALIPGGWILLEVGAGQGEEVMHCLQGEGFANLSLSSDLGGIPRVVSAQAL